jgi:hypothetical protein
MGNPNLKAGPGRPKGMPNKITTAVKDMVAGALEQVGGQDYLARQAEENPSAFLALVGKIIPLQVTGEGDGPLVIKVVRFSDEPRD